MSRPDPVMMPVAPELVAVVARFNDLPAGAARRAGDRALAEVLELLRQAAGCPAPEPGPPTSLGEADTAISACIDKHGPLRAKEVAWRCTEDGCLMTDQTVRDRMRRGLPLRRLGYYCDNRAGGYMKPRGTDEA